MEKVEPPSAAGGSSSKSAGSGGDGEEWVEFTVAVEHLQPRWAKLCERLGASSAVVQGWWETLREKSRVRIEHPDIPEALRDAAGELTAKL